MKRVLIIGMGESGEGALELLLEQGYLATGLDKNGTLFKSEKFKKWQERGVLFFEKINDIDLKEIDFVILSPGVSRDNLEVKRAQTFGLEIIGEVDFAFRFCKNRAIGITGSNGKTTVTLLVEFVLNRAQKMAKSVGNVGTSLSSYVLKAKKEEILVVELSSYQLETMKDRVLDAAVILNITPDHLDRYKNMEEYALSKVNIYNCLKKGAKLFASKDVVAGYLSNRPSVYCLEGERDGQNIFAALHLCMEMGVKEDLFFELLKEFKKPPHRIEFVAKIGGVNFYDDSKATNIDSVLYALEVVREKVVLIAGGADKRLSFESWQGPFKKRVKKVFAIGKSAFQIKDELKGIDVEIVSSLKEAVEKAYVAAGEGEAVLLSPGCSSLDMFKNYKHRGEEFKRFVKGVIR